MLSVKPNDNINNKKSDEEKEEEKDEEYDIENYEGKIQQINDKMLNLRQLINQQHETNVQLAINLVESLERGAELDAVI